MAKKRFSIFKLLFIGTAIVMLFSWVVAFISYQNITSFVNNSIKTGGIVIDYEPKRKVFRPVVSFADKKGKDFEFTAEIGYKDTTKVARGSKVEVIYNEKNPAKYASIYDFWQLWMPTLMITLFGSLPFLILVGLWLILKPKAKDASGLD